MALQVYYKFDNDYKDYSGNKRDLTNNNVTLISDLVNKAASFNGTSSYLTSTYKPFIDRTTAFSIAFFIKTTESSANYIWSTLLSNVGVFIDIDANGYIGICLAATLTTDDVYLQYQTALNDGNKHHIVFTYNGGNASPSDFEMYVDGQKVTLTTVRNNMPLGGSLTADNMYFGSTSSGGAGFTSMTLDEFRIYDTVIDVVEIDRLLYYQGKFEVVIESRDYTRYLMNLEFNEIFARIFTGKLMMFDKTYEIMNTINFNNEVEIYYLGVRRFNGVITEKYREKRKGVVVYLISSKSIFMLDKFISINYTNRTLDYMIKDIIDTYFSGTFTYNNVDTRSITYPSIKYSGQSAWFILQDLAKLEDLQLWVDANNDIHLKDLFSVDSGVTYDVDTKRQIKSAEFPDLSQTVKNAITVYSKQKTPDGKGGVAYRYNNLESQSRYKRIIEHPPITLNDADTEDECIREARKIIDRLAFVLQDGKLVVRQNISLMPGQTVRITFSKKNFSSKQFIIKSVKHTMRPFQSELSLAEVDNNTVDLLVSVFNALRKNEERFRGSNATISNGVIISEKIRVRFYASVYRIIFGSRRYNSNTKFNSFSMLAGSTQEQQVLGEQKMVLTNVGKKKLLDILTGASSLDLTAANLWGGLGTGTTSEQITDTDLETPVDINSDVTTVRQDMDSGYPNRIDDYNLEMQFTVSDTDVTSQAFNEIGLFDAKSSGVLYSRLVTATAFNKNPNENLKVKIRMEMVDT